VAETVPQAGWNQTNLNLTADGSLAGLPIAGYTTALGNTPSAALRITYTMAAAQNRVRGIRLWNQGGGDLTDQDGINHFTAEFYAGAVLLATQTWQVGNLGNPFTRTLPNGLELQGVTSVVLRTLDKQTGSTQAPLWREFQLLEFQPVFPCRRRTGVLEWYDAAGNLVANGDVQSCQTPAQPWIPAGVVLHGAFFGDDPTGTAENLCAIVPAPLSTTGLAAPVGGCYDPSGSSTPSVTWGPTGSVEMEYANGPGGQASGGVVVNFTVPEGLITWPTSAFQMDVGETVMSNTIPGGHHAILTYVSGPPMASPSGTVQTAGGANISLHPLTTNIVAPIRFRLDFITA